MAEDTRPDDEMVTVVLNEHLDSDVKVNPGRVSLGWLRQYGGGKWVEVDPYTGKPAAAADPASGTVTEVLARVESGQVTAADALAAEQAKGDDARQTLISKLEALTSAGTGA